MPRPKVTRPETALQSSPYTPAKAGSRARRSAPGPAPGLGTAPLRISSSVSSAAETVPTSIIVVRTPRMCMRYGETTL